MDLLIKNMVCDRCKRVVKDELERLGLSVLSIELGRVALNHTLDQPQVDAVAQMLQSNGFELITDRKAALSNQIKQLLLNDVRSNNLRRSGENLSEYLARRMGYEYSYLSALFSAQEGLSIERYVIAQKIELAKEWLLYDEMSLTDIAYQLGYSSVAHLSNQFKQQTGLNPTEFKRTQAVSLRRSLDQVLPSMSTNPLLS